MNIPQENRRLINTIITLPNDVFPSRKFFLEDIIKGNTFRAQANNWGITNKKFCCKIQKKENVNESTKKYISSLKNWQESIQGYQQQTIDCLIRIYEQKEWQNYTIQLMELGEMDLKTFLEQNQQIDLNQKENISKQIAWSINQIHSSQYIHNQIIPQHIIKVQQQFKLSGFSCVTKQIGMQLGVENNETLIYKAPELFLENTLTSKASDIWSLGCVIYELLSQQQLIIEEQYTEIRNIILNHLTNQSVFYDKIDNLQVPQNWKYVLKEMLNPNPNYRPSSQQVYDWIKNINGYLERNKNRPDEIQSIEQNEPEIDNIDTILNDIHQNQNNIPSYININQEPQNQNIIPPNINPEQSYQEIIQSCLSQFNTQNISEQEKLVKTVAFLIKKINEDKSVKFDSRKLITSIFYWKQLNQVHEQNQY